MFEKLESVEKRFEELTTKISDPAVIADNNEWRKLVKEHSSIQDIVTKYREYKQTVNNMKEAEEMMNDSELKELAEEEYYSSKDKLSKIEEELKILLIPSLITKSLKKHFFAIKYGFQFIIFFGSKYSTGCIIFFLKFSSGKDFNIFL